MLMGFGSSTAPGADVGIGVVELCAPASRSTGAIPMDADGSML